MIGISAVGEGCKIQMEPVLGEVVENIVPFLQDPVGNIHDTMYPYIFCDRVVGNQTLL